MSGDDFVKKIISILLIAVFSVVCFSSCAADEIVAKMHLERIPDPIVRLFVLDNIGRPLNIEPYNYKSIDAVTWDMLDEEPQDYPDGAVWFSDLNYYTRAQLKIYMQENNLYIKSKPYYFSSDAIFDEMLEILQFGNVDDLDNATDE